MTVDDDGRGQIIDIKTGQPRASDNVQVMIYMYALPHIPQFRGMELDGRLVYRGGHHVDIPASAVDDALSSRIFST